MTDRPSAAADLDATLWGRLSRADESAFVELFARHRDAVYTFAFRRTASWSTAEDVTQATFTTLWRRARRGDVAPLRLNSARPALLAMARHEAANLRRTAERHRLLVDRVAAHDVPGLVEHPAVLAEAEDVMRRIRELLRTLPRGQREVVELVAWADLPMAEAAAVLGVPTGTVKSRLSRARRRLVEAGAADLVGSDRK